MPSFPQSRVLKAANKAVFYRGVHIRGSAPIPGGSTRLTAWRTGRTSREALGHPGASALVRTSRSAQDHQPEAIPSAALDGVGVRVRHVADARPVGYRRAFPGGSGTHCKESAIEAGSPGVTTKVDVDGYVALDPKKLLEQAAGLVRKGLTLIFRQVDHRTHGGKQTYEFVSR